MAWIIPLSTIPIVISLYALSLIFNRIATALERLADQGGPPKEGA